MPLAVAIAQLLNRPEPDRETVAKANIEPKKMNRKHYLLCEQNGTNILKHTLKIIIIY